jgi:hypothetical protein
MYDQNFAKKRRFSFSVTFFFIWQFWWTEVQLSHALVLCQFSFWKMEKSCCVGKIVESKCNLKHYSSIAESIPLCNLTLDEQRVIKLRVKSDNISFICRHHLFVLLTYYDRIWKKSLCCDPYPKHGNKSVKGDTTISLEFSDQIFCATNSLMRLIPDEKICRVATNY